MSSAFSPALLQSLGAMLMASPDANQPNPQLSQALQTAQPGTPLAQAAGMLGGSNTPVVNDASMASGAAQLDGSTAAQTALGQASQNTANVQQGAREIQGQVAKAGKAEVSAATDRVEASRMEADQMAPVHQEFAARLQSMNQEFSTAQATIKARADQAFTTYLQSSKDYSNAHTHDWWSTASTGAQVLGVISQALAGGIQGLTGNLGSETPLDRVIRMDIERQKFEIQKTGDVADKSYNQFNLLTQQFGSEVLAEQALYTAAYESTKNRIDSLLKASGAGPNTAAYKYGQALIQDANAKQAQYVAKAKEATLSLTSNAVLQDSNLKMNYAQLWNNSQAAAANASTKPVVEVSGVPGSQGLPEQDRADLMREVKETKNGILQADNARNILQQVADKKLDFSQAQPQLQAALGQITLSQHRMEDIKRMGASGQELVGALTGGESGIRDYVDSLAPGIDGTYRGRSPAQRAKLLETFMNELRRGLGNDAGAYSVNGQKLKYKGDLSAAALRKEMNNDSGLPEGN